MPDQLELTVGTRSAPAGASAEIADGGRPHLLLVGSGAREYREYLLRSIAARYRVHLFCSTEPTWERSYLSGWTLLPTTVQAADMVQAAAALDAGEHIDGVLCWDEARILPASEVAAALGLPGGDVDAIARCRDKHLTRTAFDQAEVPQPRSALVGTLAAALTAAERIGFPVVLKPRALAASLGVVLVSDPADLAAHFGFARDTTVPEAPHYDESVLVEQYVSGPEISVDCAVHGGRVEPICLARKELGYPPYFEEIGHRVSGSDPLRVDPEILDILCRAHRALGLRDGMTHVELRLSPAGPKVIEVNGRLGGDLIPYLGGLATGVHPGLVAAAVACGRRPVIRADRNLTAAVRFCYVDRETTIGSVCFTGDPPAAVDRAEVLVQPGRRVAPPPAGTVWGRIALVTAASGEESGCQDAIEAMVAGLRVEPAR